MSKGIGSNYVNRMKRYHVPFIRNPCEQLKVVCDRAFYHDGAFKYKLPRYYRDRLFRKKFPCDALIWNPKKRIYENKIVYRFKSKNPLAVKMQNEIRNRISAEYARRFAELSSGDSSLSATEIDLLLARFDASAKVDRFKVNFAKMSRFYNFNMSKNKKF